MGVDKLLEVFYHNLRLFEFFKNLLCPKNRIQREMNFLYIVPDQEFFSKFFNQILSQFFSRMNFLEVSGISKPRWKNNFRHVSFIFPSCQKPQVLLR